jgi:hypothetical protein
MPANGGNPAHPTKRGSTILATERFMPIGFNLIACDRKHQDDELSQN